MRGGGSGDCGDVAAVFSRVFCTISRSDKEGKEKEKTYLDCHGFP
jgi:hypothetical protein